MKKIIFSANSAIRAFKKIKPEIGPDYHIAHPNTQRNYHSLKSVPDYLLTTIITQPRFKCIYRTFCINSFTYLRHKMSQRSIASFFSKPGGGSSKLEGKKSATSEKETSQKIDSPKAEKVDLKEDDSLLSPIKKSSSKRRKNRALESSDEEDIENETLPANKNKSPSEKRKSLNGTQEENQKTSTKRPGSPNSTLKVKIKKRKSEEIKKEIPVKKVKTEEKSDTSSPEIKKENVESSKSEIKKNTAAKNFFSLSKASNKENEKDQSKDFEKSLKKGIYHPIDDAVWKRGEPTPYLAFAKTLAAVESTPGRLKTIEILANYFRSVMILSPDDLLYSVYLCLNRIAPAYEGIELGIGEGLLVKAIASTTGRSAQQIKADQTKEGDLGIVAENSRSTQRTMFQPQPLKITSVFKQLKAIAEMTGHSSQNTKVQKIQSMLVACRQDGPEARYLIRSLQGKLRIGLAEQSVLQAIAHACIMTPPAQGSLYPPKVITAFNDATSDKFKEALEGPALKLKTAYCECPCYDKMIPILLKEGIDGVAKSCKLTPGIPLKPMLAHPTKGVQEVLTRFENCKYTCEWKYDGERAQIHLLENGKIQIFSRNQEDNTTKYPDIINRFEKCKLDGVKSCVIDSEAVAWDREKKQIQPFQVLSTRKRKDANESEIKVQVAVFAFDILYLNGEALVRKPFRERRELLQKHFKEVEGEFIFAKSGDPETMEEVQELLEDSVKENCEGLMVKTLDVDATYEIAKRSHNWLKLKKDYLDGVGDTLDVVVMGGYLGKGKRTGRYGGFLLGCYDLENEEYQTLCKIGTGFSDEDLQQHYDFFQAHKVDKPKSYYAFDTSLAPDHWFDPVQVWEIKAADLSISPVHHAGKGIVHPDRGISLRFPRFIRIRDDKSAEDATSAQQVADMYNSQEQVKNQKSSKPSNIEDDDY